MKRVAKLKICKICERETYRLGRHIKDHNISDKDYYDTYINSIRDLKCSNPDCNKEIKFQNINIGYSQFCSTKCSMVVRNQDPVFKAKLVENMINIGSEKFKDFKDSKHYKGKLWQK
jgi:hypothetical protein